MFFYLYSKLLSGLLLQPGECRIRGFKRFNNVWAGGFATIARCAHTGVIYACGLNNYGQLALVKQAHKSSEVGNDVKEELSESMLLKKQGPLIQFMLTPANGFAPEKKWKQFAISMHHTLALTSSGKACRLANGAEFAITYINVRYFLFR